MKKTELSNIEHQVTYRFLGGKPEDGILSCGFMRKPTGQKSQINFIIPYYSCFVLLDGSGEYWDDTGFHQTLVPGCMVQRLPNRVHSTRVEGDGKWLEFYISFGKCAFDSLLALGQLTEKVPVLHITEPSVYLQSFLKLFLQMSSAPDASLLSCLLEAQHLACTLSQDSTLSTQGASSVVEQACLLLEKDRKKELSLQQIAKQLCIGYEALRKQFYKEIKKSPEQYRQQKRMITAQMMLMEGESVQSVAKELGYSDAYAFSKQFKNFFGCAPAFYLKSL